MTNSLDSAGLLGPTEVRTLAEQIGVTPTKKLGQNFVHDPNTVRKIVRLAGVKEQDEVLEVGPGLGSLTLGILEAGAHVTAVEIDKRLAGLLPETAAKMQPGALLRVVEKDALLLEAKDVAVAPKVLVANLPYNVSVPILMHLLMLFESLENGLVMVQAEVGRRIAARPGSKEYGAPSAKAAWFGDWQIASSVSRQIFWPVPGVDSVLVSFAKREESLGSQKLRDKTFELVNQAFLGRRKMLRQSLMQGIGAKNSDEASAILEAAKIDPTARAENLAISDFLKLAKSLV